jgi:hypothetical protein
MPGLPIISADERLRSPAAVKGQIWGRYGSGKTWQVKTLMEPTALASGVLVLDAEAGLLSIQDVAVDVISLRSWTDACDLACFFGGANPAFRDDQPYSEAHYQHAVERYGDRNRAAAGAADPLQVCANRRRHSRRESCRVGLSA